MKIDTFMNGIDSLYLTYRGCIRNDVLFQLREMKKCAQSTNINERESAYIDLDEETFVVLDKGDDSYAYRIKNEKVQVFIASSSTRAKPEIKVQILSKFITVKGFNNAIAYSRKIVSKVVCGVLEEKVSRVDLFADFTTDKDIENISRNLWIARASSLNTMHVLNQFTGWYRGAKSPIYGKLYNKTIEIKKSKKYYLTDYWEQGGWNGEDNVWRLEFQARRTVLNQFKINTVHELKESMNDLWKYLTYKWLRLSIDDGTQNRSKWETDPWWEEIQNISFGDGCFSGRMRVIRNSTSPDIERVFLMGLGYLTSYAALNGNPTINLEFMEKYLMDMTNFLQEHIEKYPEYSSPKHYIESRISAKVRKFKTLD